MKKEGIKGKRKEIETKADSRFGQHEINSKINVALWQR